jgi:hypothetical protein
MKPFRQSCCHAAAAVLLLLPATAVAQTNLLITGGTHVRSGATAHAYILGQLESAGAPGPVAIDLTKPEFSVYQKDGNPSDPGSYRLVGVVRPVVDEATVSALLDRSWLLKPGTSAAAQEAELGNKLDTMFGALSASANSQSVAAKLANVIAASLADPNYREDLTLLGKTFPGVNMCLGNAWAGPVTIAGPTTFELRLRDASGQDAAVTARVTVNGSLVTPSLLPAPGTPQNSGIEISPTAPPLTAFSDFRAIAGNATVTAGFNEFKEQMAGRKLNRAVRLRWSTPNELRQRSILQSGYNLWRIPAANLAAHPDWLVSGPAKLSQIQALGAVKANTLPIMIPEDLTPAQAADAADKETNFFTDSLPKETILPAGAQDFAYFATAVDVLGRDGDVSPGIVVPICNRMPPTVVKGLKVLNDYNWLAGSGKQRFKLAWSPSSAGPDGGMIEYEIYRWDRYDGAQRSVGATPVATTAATTWTDNLAGSPNETNAHQTFWYTVRAVKVTGGGRFLAGHSGPVFGVIRDRKGPGITSTWIFRPCLEPTISAKPSSSQSVTDTTPGRLIPVTLSCTRLKESIAWAEFSVKLGNNPGDQSVIARIEFTESNVVEHVLQFEAAKFPAEGPSLASIRCRVGAVNGAVSDYVLANPPGNYPINTASLTLPFEADIAVTMVDSDAACPNGGITFPLNPLGGYLFTLGGLRADPDTSEFKFYRRVNDGPLTFIDHRLVHPTTPFVESEFTDSNPPPINGGRVCYYAQAFDSDGNAGPMELMKCIVYPPLALPRPVLDKITPNAPAGDGSRSLHIKWSCSPVGVDRFQLLISKNGEVPPADLGVDFLQGNSATQGVVVDGQGGKKFGVYVTSRVEGRFSGNATAAPPADLPVEFSIDLPAGNGDEFTIAVKALGVPADAIDGYSTAEGRLSNVRIGKWTQEDFSSPNIPWPVRGVPKISDIVELYLGAWTQPGLQTYPLATALKASLMNGSFDGIGVRIGQFVLGETPSPSPKGFLMLHNTRLNPHLGIYRTRNYLDLSDNSPASLYPCALYRYRVKNTTDPGLTSDLVQVSPLIESIAYGFVSADGTENQAAGPNTAIYDPFIAFHNLGPVSGGTSFGMYIKDTLPVIHGATYRYLLVRFSYLTKEPYDVIPVPDPITVP